MKKPSMNATAAAIALGFALVAPLANAGPNLVTNGDSSSSTLGDYPGPPSNWTFTQGPNVGVTTALTSSYPADFALGVYHYASMICFNQCVPGSSISLSQQINSLVTGHQYQLNYLIGGAKTEQYDDPAGGAGQLYVDSGPYHVAFGGQSTAPFSIAALSGPYPVNPVPWQSKTETFTYTGSSGSAVLEFFLGMTSYSSGCVPCGQYEQLANVSLMDLGPQPPGPNVSEPSTLGTLGLGLGALGLFYQRRRNCAV